MPGCEFQAQARRGDFAIATATAIGLAIILAGPRGLLALTFVWGVSSALARWWTRDLGGLTGDTYGALCEIAEVVTLAVLSVSF
jgi:adenosylcobinamide-GDP ribazoletransferase